MCVCRGRGEEIELEAAKLWLYHVIAADMFCLPGGRGLSPFVKKLLRVVSPGVVGWGMPNLSQQPVVFVCTPLTDLRLPKSNWR